jgi:two-component system, chemotaxis family, chemotaxis protein CheY
MSAAEAKEKACKVLIIEDDPDDIFLFRRAVERARLILNREINLEDVGNGLDALIRVSRLDVMDELPDVLVLDLNMPRLNGIEFLRSLRNSLVLWDLPVFVLTTSGESAIHDEATRAGADKVYIKPHNADGLVQIALEIVARSAPAATVQ